ncbi:MAG: hypothetical protein K2K00_02800, partial [Muribaculaceae bacterium]|nr:hypothetical protein [Muribaculaceae bacterium]
MMTQSISNLLYAEYLPQTLTATMPSIALRCVSWDWINQRIKWYFEDACDEIAARAAEMDALWRPMWCHCRITDKNGTELLLTEPVLLGEPMPDELLIPTDNSLNPCRLSTLPYEFKRKAWRVAVDPRQLPEQLRAKDNRIEIFIRLAAGVPHIHFNSTLKTHEPYSETARFRLCLREGKTTQLYKSVDVATANRSFYRDK